MYENITQYILMIAPIRRTFDLIFDRLRPIGTPARLTETGK